MKNRWLIALSAVGIHLCIGSAYAWSVFSKPLQLAFGWSLKEVNLTFGLAIFFLGISAAVMGHFVEKHGPRVAAMVSAAFWSGGLLVSALAVHLGSIWLLYLGYGVLGGCGLGTGYITPVSTLVKWFPDRRGLASGMAIMGFGFASLIAGPVLASLIVSLGIAMTFLTVGLAYLVIMVAAAQYLAPPPEGWLPAGYQQQLASGHKKAVVDIMPMAANDAVKTLPFYALWTMMFLNITCGIAVISVASPLAQEVTGMSALAAGAIVGFNGLFNGLGRIGWASASDWLTRPVTFILFFIIEIIAFNLLPSLHNVLLFQIVLYLIMSCYGGGFATMSAYIGDIFGTKQLGVIYGYILTAWALAGIVGSSLASFLRDATGSYAVMMQIFSGLFVLALAISLVMRRFVLRALTAKLPQAKLA